MRRLLLVLTLALVTAVITALGASPALAQYEFEPDPTMLEIGAAGDMEPLSRDQLCMISQQLWERAEKAAKDGDWSEAESLANQSYQAWRMAGGCAFKPGGFI